ncbi:hypothetical protein PC116_g23818 [Phytophthora cactorum]|uniref:Uncharacterized protein n=1 Tax=Phytophthora cactorum TaxID=29920 RepID=A0A8T1K148_9STRA|nr:hypothetical protein PC112_g19642 [Phytophthora cactorum]KAG2876003.1 hypothetical protein PC114_g24415 [Phytophthora cactorum]KAG2882964.1 hypothetical protein PC115_g21787 [Phytophthora cactorum]KAG4227801.1 hypothetical protein PC116_g23818 [Phytophthora cactorum]
MAASEAALSFVDEFADGRAAPVPTQPLEVLSKQEMEWALGFPSSSKDSPRSSSPSASPQPNSENHHTTTDEDGNERRIEVAYLKEKVAQLEAELESLQQHRSSTKLIKQDGHDDSTSVAEQSAWKPVAQQQRKRREKAEIENARLKLVLES